MENNRENKDTRSESQKFSDGFTKNAGEIGDAAKTAAQSGWDAGKGLAFHMYDDPLVTVESGLLSS
jgi:hypothetical protein